MREADDYALLDSGDGAKLERFGAVLLNRPSPQALWPRSRPASTWRKAWATYHRSSRGGGRWERARELPESWTCRLGGFELLLKATGFGHVGAFAEQRPFWSWISDRCARRSTSGRPLRVLNLFAYTGGSSLAAARGGAEVTHCDASRGVVQWASENARRNGGEDLSIRWIVDDTMKYLRREAKRENQYDAIVLDPPSFGRGPKGEVFKLEEQIQTLLKSCVALLSPTPSFVLLTAHTPGLGPLALQNLLAKAIESCTPPSGPGRLAASELSIPGAEGTPCLPCGSWAAWSAEGTLPLGAPDPSQVPSQVSSPVPSQDPPENPPASSNGGA